MSPGGPHGETPGTDTFPASFAQERLWLAAQLEPDVPLYTIGFGVAVGDDRAADAVPGAIEQLTARHEVLRTALVMVDGRLTQTVYASVPVEVPRIDVGDLPPERREEAALRVSAEEAAKPMPVDQAPLWRARLVRTGPDAWVLAFVVHHGVFDAHSVRIFMQELQEAVDASVEGRAPRFADLPIQYGDFAAWQRSRLEDGSLDEQLAYWDKQLTDPPAGLELPADHPRPPKKTYAGEERTFTVPADVVDAVQALARAEGTTPFTVYLAAYGALLSRLSGQHDVMVGSPVTGRTLPELDSVIGMFINTLLLRVDTSGDPPFRTLVDRVRHTVLGALDNQDVPFDKLVELYQPDRDPSRSPLYQAGLNMLPLRAGQSSNRTAKFDVLIDLSEPIDGVSPARLEYSTDLYAEATATAFIDRLLRLLSAAVASPDTRIGALPLLTDAERAALTAGVDRPITSPPVTDRIAAWVAERPDALAVVDPGGHRLTYAQLDRQANQLAHHLRAAGVGPDDPVALLCDGGAGQVVGLLGALRAGGAYLPLDPHYPPDRLSFFLDDAGAAAVVTTEVDAHRLPRTGLPVIRLDTDAAALAAHPDTPPEVDVPPDTLAYLIYTSGSTGRPKGVGVTRRNLAAYLDGLDELLRPEPGRVFTTLAPLTFDFSVTMVYGALCSGGTLHVVGRELAADAQWVAKHLRTDRVDYLKLTPSHLAALQAAQRAVADSPALVPARALLLGGEASTREWFDDLRATSAKTGCAVLNHYGPTETTVGVLALPANAVPDPVAEFTPIGRPLTHARAYVLDADGQPVPPGVAGELCVGGAQLARGYHRRPGLTAERFVPDPYGSTPGGRLYRTGDRVRRLPSGALEFLGRFDDQVKVRGYRIELGEVRACLVGHPQVAAAAVVASGRTPQDARLVAYVVPHTGPAGDELGRQIDMDAVRRHAADRLPEFMVPAHLVTLDQLPLTGHGKVDRSKLPDPTETTGQDEGEPVEPPRSGAEQSIADLFARLLERERVGRDESFFALGGHSLLATQLVTRLRATFDVELPLRAVFEAPTVAGLAERVAAQRRRGTRRLPPVRRAPRNRPLPASFGQQRLWFLDQLERLGSLYTTNLGVRITGELDVDVLRRCLTELVSRHDALRTRLVRGDDGESLFQVVDDEPRLPMRTVDLTGRSGLAGGPPGPAELAELVDAQNESGFDLATEPPLRGLLVALRPDEHLLVLTIHHAMTDAWSGSILVSELTALYPALLAGERSPLPRLVVGYPDYAVWQRDRVTGPLADTQIAYWRRQLAGMPPRLELPTDRPRPARLDYRGDHVSFRVPDDVAERLRALGAESDATLFMTMLTGFLVLLGRYAGENDLVVGTPAANRPRPELESVVGFFLNTLVLRTDSSGDPSFRELLARVRTTTLDAFANAEVPFEALVDELRPERDLAGTPLVQVLFTMEDGDRTAATAPNLPAAAGESGESPGELAMRWEPVGAAVSRFDLTLYLWRRSSGLTGAVEYRTSLFDPETVGRFADHFTAVLTAAAADPDRPVSRLELLSGAERDRIAASGRGPERDYPPPTVPEQVAASDGPPTGSVCWDGRWLSSGEMAERVRRLARRLRRHGVGRESVVGLCLPRGLDLVVAVHAVWAAGGAYLPLEPEYPDERLRSMLADSGAAVVVTDDTDRFDGYDVIGADTVPDEPDGTLTWAPVPPDAAAYVIFTSGSTGRPKGVVVSHRALANRIRWMQEAFGLGADDRVLHKTPFSFDVSVWELCWPLVAGAGMVIAPPGAQRDPAALAAAVADHGVTTMHFVPSMLDGFVEWVAAEPGAADRIRTLRRVICSGEALTPALADRFRAVLPGVELHNLYGPTEAAIDVTWHRCEPGEDTIPLGRPVANTRLEILDPNLDRVPVGVPGELYLAGVQLARGYAGRPSLTAERFVPDPYADRPGGRLYATGDRARWLPSGEVEYLGRLDGQVKVRGQRVEVGEVETALTDLPGVRAAAVRMRDGRLAGWVVGDAEPDVLRRALATRLPEHMIPAVLVGMDALPVTANGKLDTAALPDPAPVETLAGYEPPAGQAEQAVAAVWAEVLDVGRVGAHDGFFALGGDSIRSLKVIARLRAAGWAVELQQIFTHQTVRELAAVLTRAEPEPDEPAERPTEAAEEFGLLDAADLQALAEQVRGGGDAHEPTIEHRSGG